MTNGINEMKFRLPEMWIVAKLLFHLRHELQATRLQKNSKILGTDNAPEVAVDITLQNYSIPPAPGKRQSTLRPKAQKNRESE